MKKIWMLAIGGLVLSGTLLATAEFREQRGAAVAGDFRNAGVAELRDSQGTVLLRGTFIVGTSDDDDESKRNAALAPLDANSKATGTVEVEYANASPDAQEIEIEAQGFTAGADFTLFIDNTQVAVVKADRRGRIDSEFETR